MNKKTACIYFFGGDPSPRLRYLLKVSRMARERNEGKVLRICRETNGSMSERMRENMGNMHLLW